MPKGSTEILNRSYTVKSKDLETDNELENFNLAD